MPAYPSAPASANLAQALARQGLDLLSGVYRGEAATAQREATELIARHTGINLADADVSQLSAPQWAQLKEFEFQQQVWLLDLRQRHGADEPTPLVANGDGDGDGAARFVRFYAAAITLLAFAFVFYAAFGHAYTHPASTPLIYTVLGFLLGASLSATLCLLVLGARPLPRGERT